MAAKHEQPGTGAYWCRTREKKKTRRSNTPGSAKGENCKATPVDKHMAKCSRSYKHKGYSNWCRKMVEMRAKYGG